MFEVGIDEKMLEQILVLSPTRELAERALAETGSQSVEAAASWLKSNSELDNVLKPTTEKTCHDGCAGKLTYASAAMQGWRSYMEDVSVIEKEISALPGTSYFAVFDGHGGDSIARACATQLLPAIIEHVSSSSESGDKLRDAVVKGFTALDAKLSEGSTDGPGSTALAALVAPKHIIVANLGDTSLLFRCVLVTGGKAVQLSRDHKPTIDAETKRIKKAGGNVTTQRVNGQLAVSRAFGDYSFKKAKLPPGKQMVTAEPDVEVRPRSHGDELLVLATDGIWDVIPNERMVAVARAVAEGAEVHTACAALLEEALHAGSRDNMTVMLVNLKGTFK